MKKNIFPYILTIALNGNKKLNFVSIDNKNKF